MEAGVLDKCIVLEVRMITEFEEEMKLGWYPKSSVN